jgi:lysophospholipase L1-like esterase
VVKSGPGDAPRYAAGKDYGVDTRWATLGRLPGGIGPNQPVWVDYDCGWGRIDSIVVSPKGVVSLLPGTPHNATPHPPASDAAHLVIANVWIPGRLPRLTAENLYPILEPSYPRGKHKGAPAATLLPKTWKKLRNGQPLHILAWGDSVTAGGQASDAAHQYQQRFVTLLKARFPKAQIRLTTAGWGGRNSDSFLKEPPGAEFNFEHAVLEKRPDVVVMEFVNDAYMTPEVVEQKYSSLQKRFEEIGAEWIILTPHFVRPDWMGASTVRVEADPRPYVAGLRQFTARHRVALADASLRWGHLWKEGIPYITLLSNSINHPDDRGHELFAQALLELFT